MAGHIVYIITEYFNELHLFNRVDIIYFSMKVHNTSPVYIVLQMELDLRRKKISVKMAVITDKVR